MIAIEFIYFQFQRSQLGACAFQFGRWRLQSHFYAGGSGIDQVDRLVRQLPSCQITPRQFHGRSQGFIADMDIVIRRITCRQAAQHQGSVGVVRFVHLDDLEATLQSRITFKILLVFRPGCRRDGAQFATR